jgi:hypothetical protein
MSRTDDEIRGKIEERLEKTCQKLGWNSSYLEEYTMAAAVKASAYFQTLGYEYGDRTPSVYKLNDTILELFSMMSEDKLMNDKEMFYTATGMFRVTGFWDEVGEQWEFNIALELTDIYEHRILNKE